MKAYRHWLKIDGYDMEDHKQYKIIEDYLKKYPDSEIEIYQYDNDLFNKVIALYCWQDYNNLDMLVNSGSTRLRRLQRKPRGITRVKSVEIRNGGLELTS